MEKDVIKIFRNYFNESLNLRLRQAEDAVKGIAKIIASELLLSVAEVDPEGYEALHEAFCPLCKKSKDSGHGWEEEYEIIVRALLYAAKQLKKRKTPNK